MTVDEVKKGKQKQKPDRAGFDLTWGGIAAFALIAAWFTAPLLRFANPVALPDAGLLLGMQLGRFIDRSARLHSNPYMAAVLRPLDRAGLAPPPLRRQTCAKVGGASSSSPGQATEGREFSRLEVVRQLSCCQVRFQFRIVHNAIV